MNRKDAVGLRGQDFISVDEQILLAEVYTQGCVDSRDMFGHERKAAEKLVELGLIVWKNSVYELEKPNYKLAKFIIAYEDTKKKWPNPFYPGYPTNPEQSGYHIIALADGNKRLCKYIVSNDKEPYYRAVETGQVFSAKGGWINDSKYIASVSFDFLDKENTDHV